MSTTEKKHQADHLAFGAAQTVEKIAHYPADVKPHVIWLAEYIRAELDGSLKVFQSLCRDAGINRAHNTWYKILSGKYFTNSTGTAGIIEDIKLFREFLNKGVHANGHIPFIETTTWSMVDDYITALRAPNNICRIGIIVSDTGTQKTACLKEYQIRNNHGATVRFEAPATAKLNKLLFKWLKCYSPRTYWKQNIQAENELRKQLNDRKCVIIENAQRLYQTTKKANQEIFSFLQEIQEDTGCTLILCWTRGFTETFLNGSERAFFEQFVGRCGGADQILTLPEKCPVQDLRLIAKTVGVEDVEAALPTLKIWAKAEGKIRILFSKLQQAKRAAQAEGSEIITLDHLEG